MEGMRLRIILCCFLLTHAESSASSNGNATECKKEESTIRTNTTDRLQRLRKRMFYDGYDAYIITTGDEHQSEYVSEYDKRRQFITGFKGSAGTAVVLKEREAALWTDARYHIQAELETDCNWQLIKSSPTITDWLVQKLNKKGQVAANPRFIAQDEWKIWSDEFNKSGITLVPDVTSSIDTIWVAGERPIEPSKKISTHDLRFAGKSWEDKIRTVREKLSAKNLKAVLVSSLTEVAWLFNLRGSDIPYVPVFKAFAVVTQKDVILYVKKKKIGSKIYGYLNENQCPYSNKSCIMVDVREYDDIYSNISRDLKGLKVVMSPAVSYAIYRKLNKDLVTFGVTPVLEEMIVKNPVEKKGMENAMLKDSVAVVAFLAMLEIQVKQGLKWDEMKAAREVAKFRSQQEYYKEESFQAISAVGDHAAIPHYIPQESTKRIIDTDHIYLLDSGGQYLDGTTDITRTLHFGTPTDFQKEAYTRVLMGVISLATFVFPEGTKDTHVDILTRRALYENGLNYGHGTGHGVGSFLSVHEFPPAIRQPHALSEGYPLQPGMFFSIEPGYYKEHEFGIRLETIFTIVKAKTKHKYDNKTFYTFEPVVWIPFERNLIKTDMLSKEQARWIEWYHAKCVTLTGRRLRQARHHSALEWLMARAVPLKQWTNKVAATRSNCALILSLLLLLTNK